MAAAAASRGLVFSLLFSPLPSQIVSDAAAAAVREDDDDISILGRSSQLLLLLAAATFIRSSE